MIKWKRIVSTVLCVSMISVLAAGCGSSDGSATKKRIIRVALSQSEEHPEYKGLVKFKDYIESELEINMKCSYSLMNFLEARQKQSSLHRLVQLILQ